MILDKPYLILVEAKKNNFEEGWGQCLAELIAAQKLNGDIDNSLFGIVSNGKGNLAFYKQPYLLKIANIIS